MSWVIVRRADGKPIFETFSARTASLFRLRPDYEVVPIREWLSRVNAAARVEQPSPTAPPKSAVENRGSLSNAHPPELLAVIRSSKREIVVVRADQTKSHPRLRDVSRTVLGSAPTKESDNE